MKSILLENSKLMPKDAFTKEVSKVSLQAPFLKTMYLNILYYLQIYKRNYKERYLNEVYS